MQAENESKCNRFSECYPLNKYRKSIGGAKGAAFVTFSGRKTPIYLICSSLSGVPIFGASTLLCASASTCICSGFPLPDDTFIGV